MVELSPSSRPFIHDHRRFFRTMNTNTTKGSVGPNVAQRYGFISSFAGPIAMAVGGLVLVGWLLGIRTLTSVIPALYHDEAEHGGLLCPCRFIALAVAASLESSR